MQATIDGLARLMNGSSTLPLSLINLWESTFKDAIVVVHERSKWREAQLDVDMTSVARQRSMFAGRTFSRSQCATLLSCLRASTGIQCKNKGILFVLFAACSVSCWRAFISVLLLKLFSNYGPPLFSLYLQIFILVLCLSCCHRSFTGRGRSVSMWRKTMSFAVNASRETVTTDII